MAILVPEIPIVLLAVGGNVAAKPCFYLAYMPYNYRGTHSKVFKNILTYTACNLVCQVVGVQGTRSAFSWLYTLASRVVLG